MAGPEKVGLIEGCQVKRISLTGQGGLRAEVLTYGARLAALWVPDRNGVLADIVLGFDRLSDWHDQGGYLGATCGRYANRIERGRFVLAGREIQLDQNEGLQHLHGGKAGLDKQNWGIESLSDKHASLTTRSADGDMGYTGNLTVRVTYRVTGLGLAIIVEASSDAATIVNIVNHSYFNLAGHGSGDVLNQELQVDAGFYLPVDDNLIPTGEVLKVDGTPFDFRDSRTIGAQMPGSGGFDHNLCLSAPLDAEGLRPCLQALDPRSGRKMKLSTTEPGVQLYTGAHFDGVHGKAGAQYWRFGGFAVETQKFPNSPNAPHFPSPLLEPGQLYRHEMRFDFTPAR